MFGFLRRRRRKRLQSRPFPPAWLSIIRRNVPYYAQLSDREQRQLQDAIKVFLAEKRFEGCGGLAINDEIRVTIAAQACILIFNRPSDYYPRMKSIFVYPHEFFAEQRHVRPDGVVVEGEFGLLGESWRHGPVVLSWDSVRHGAADSHDGRNVVFHEFAHQLDSESSPVDGAPRLERRSMYIAWARVLGAEYAELTDSAAHNRRTVMDTYGATSPAEFFAVVTECFFEKPTQLRDKHPDLYEQLRVFYHQDPAARVYGGNDQPEEDKC